jgi:hypothetical protein
MPRKKIIPVEIPDEVQKFLDLLVDPNYTPEQIDEIMSYPIGETSKKIREQKWLRDTIKDARMVALRRAGINKAICYEVYHQALTATRTSNLGATEPDFDTRIKAADRLLNMLGERPAGGSGNMVAGTNGRESFVITWGGDNLPEVNKI